MVALGLVPVEVVGHSSHLALVARHLVEVARRRPYSLGLSHAEGRWKDQQLAAELAVEAVVVVAALVADLHMVLAKHDDHVEEMAHGRRGLDHCSEEAQGMDASDALVSDLAGVAVVVVVRGGHHAHQTVLVADSAG